MRRPLRLLAAAALTATAGTAVATAQTVVVRKATPGSAVEVVVNAATVANATVDTAGDSEVPINLLRGATKQEIDANIFVDVCDKLYRVVIAERGQAIAAQQPGCDRRSVSGLFLVRRITTLVVTVDSVIPSVLLVQGSYSLEPDFGRTWSEAPTGLVVFGGAGLGKYGNALALSCGDVVTCSGSSSWGALNAGVNLWVNPYLAAEVTLVKPRKLEITGSEDTFSFESFTDATVLTVSGKVGVPIGPVRLFGQGGTTYHQATSATTQTLRDRTITVGGVTQTVPGGTQRFELKTAGWGWTWGAGLELWLNGRFGLYAEAAHLSIRGGGVDDADGEMSEGLASFVLGARLRVW